MLQKKEISILKDGQEMPQSQIADQHTATRGRDTEYDRPHHNLSETTSYSDLNMRKCCIET